MEVGTLAQAILRSQRERGLIRGRRGKEPDRTGLGLRRGATRTAEKWPGPQAFARGPGAARLTIPPAVLS